MTEYTDQAGVVSKYKYNPRGQITETREAVGTALERLTTYGYDQYGQTTRVTRRHSITAVNPALDATATYVYDNFGNVTEAKDPENNVVKMTAHDVMGNTLTMIDGRNKTRTMEYSKQGWLLKSISALGFVSRMEYNFSGDLIKSITPIDATNNEESVYSYDNEARIIEIRDPSDGINKQIYDDEGRLIKANDARQVKTKIEYDGRGRINKVIDGNLNEIETVYGDKSNALEGLVAEIKYPSFTESFKYDNSDRSVEVRQKLSPTLEYVSIRAFDAVGNLISMQDAEARTTLMEYDALRRLTKEIDTNLGETTYTYDQRDNLLSVTDANNHAHSFTYDRADRKITDTRPLGEAITYLYDANSNLVERKSPSGATHRFFYDDNNRLQKEQHFTPNSTVAAKTINFFHDQRSLLTGYDDGLTKGSYAYDKRGDRISETTTFGLGAAAFSKTVTKSYEPNGLQKTLTYPDVVGVLSFTYDDNNHLKTYKIPGLASGNDTLSYQYNWNVIREVTMPANLKRTVTVDALQRPSKIEVERIDLPLTSNQRILLRNEYKYDALFNVIKKSTLDGDFDYQYDKLTRLTEVKPPLNLRQSASNPSGLPLEEYTYDSANNRKTSGHQPGSWDYNGNNELVSWGLGSELRKLHYDINGNLIEDKNESQAKRLEYIYDADDKLIEFLVNGVSAVKFSYDPFGRRIFRQTFGDGASKRWFLYSSEGLIQEINDDGGAIRTYGWSGTSYTGSDLVWQKDANGTFLALNNLQMVSEFLVNASDGSIGWSGVSEAFGKTTRRPEATTEFLLRGPGQWQDDVLNQFQNWNRNLDPVTGVFTTSGTSIMKDGINLYAYTEQNPINFIDFNGFQRFTPLPIEPIFRPMPRLPIRPAFPSNDPIYNPGTGAKPIPPWRGSPIPQPLWQPHPGPHPEDNFPPERNYDPSAEQLPPPGDCTKTYTDNLKKIINSKCKSGSGVGACTWKDGSVVVREKFQLNKSCCLARRYLMNRCFRGGDNTHRFEASRYCGFAKDCLSKYNLGGCSCPPLPNYPPGMVNNTSKEKRVLREELLASLEE